MIQVNTHGDVTSLEGIAKYRGLSIKVHLFIIDGLLIDSGPISLKEQLTPFLQEADYDKVILTHIHEDHVGCARWIQDNKNVPIYIHPLSVVDCIKTKNYPTFRQGFWGKTESFQALPLKDQIESRNGLWQIIHTPGHSDDHVILYNENTGMLFSGDLLVSVKPKSLSADESVATTIESINKVMELDIKQMFCSHRGYVENGRELLQAKKEWLEYLQTEIASLHQQGMTVEEISKQMFPEPQPLADISDGDWTPVNIVRNVLIEEALIK